MKTKLHPKYHQVTVTCACGATFVTGSTLPEIKVEICSQCHPFFTGEMRYIDTLGRVDKFEAKRKAAAGYKKDKKSKKDEGPTHHTSLKDMLTVTKIDTDAPQSKPTQG